MVKLGDMTSLLEVSFALNLAAPALFRLAEHSAMTLTRTVVGEVTSGVEGMHVTDTEMAELKRSVTLFFPALRSLIVAARLLATLSVIFAAVTFGGIVLAAIQPELEIDVARVIAFAVVAILLPGSYALLSAFLKFAVKSIIASIKDDEANRRMIVDYWRRFIEMKVSWSESSAEIEALIKQGDLLRKQFAETKKARKYSTR